MSNRPPQGAGSRYTILIIENPVNQPPNNWYVRM